MLILATVGGVVFTLAPSWPVLLTGRTLMGAGFGVMLIGSMVVISRWFPPDRFSTLSAMVLSIGLFGNLIATTPLAWATGLFGWRIVSGAAVVFTALAAVAVWLVVRDAPPGHPFLARTPERPGQMMQGLMEILRNRLLWPILALNFCNYACTFTVQGLWGGPFLREVHGFNPIEAGNVLLLAVVTYQAGMLVFGPLDRLLDTRKWIAIGGSLAIVALLAILALASRPPVWVAVGAILAIGFFSASSTMVMTHARGVFPDRLIGRGISTINTAVMLGVAVMQSLSGMIIGAFEPLPDGARTETAYRALFGVLTAVLLLAVAIYSRSKERQAQRPAAPRLRHPSQNNPDLPQRRPSRPPPYSKSRSAAFSGSSAGGMAYSPNFAARTQASCWPCWGAISPSQLRQTNSGMRRWNSG